MERPNINNFIAHKRLESIDKWKAYCSDLNLYIDLLESKDSNVSRIRDNKVK